ncbi:MAG: peptidase S8, partial [Ignavibacterium sp.]|nr:peptidase S8 [Ignavibacterium sp.]
MKTIVIIILIVFTNQAQSIYELTPGVKGNQIVLQLSNVSQSQTAENVEVKLVRQSANLKFNTTEEKINNLNKEEEKEVSFSFDVEYNIGKTKTDTIEFIITDHNTINKTKQFIFSYTGPKEYKLEQNYPNPFNPGTRISWQSPVGSWQTIKLYD